ncbi:Ras-related protein Rab-24, partial [Cricetulus griseus]
RRRKRPLQAPGALNSGRSAHNELEKRRRAQLKRCLEQLRQQMPLGVDCPRYTTLSLLRRARVHIQKLEEQEQQAQRLKEKLRSEQQSLQQQLEQLQGLPGAGERDRPRADSLDSSVLSSERSDSDQGEWSKGHGGFFKEYVGKTSLVERYVHDRFLVGPYQNTIGAAFVAKVMCVGDRTVTLGIWDTAGSERYEAMSRIYYRGAKAAIVCYDLTDSSSFERAKFWVKELRSLEEGCQIYLCGTKSDLLEEDRRRRRVDFHDVQDYADSSCYKVF